MAVKYLLLVAVAVLHCTCSTHIRKNSDPYMYKSIHVSSPIFFESELIKTLPKNLNKDVTMMLGTAPEDLAIDISKRRGGVSTRTNTLANLTPVNDIENTIDGMVDIMVKTEEVESDDPLMNDLMQMKKEMNKTMEITHRTGSGNTDADNSDNFLERVKNLLAISGIQAQLPLDCGRNPSNPSEPLTEEPLPWVVALGSREDGQFHYRCTGAIISQYHVLTDAECATSPNINVAHMNVTGTVPEPFAVENFVVGRRVHPSITDTDSFLDGDNIGILELALPIEFNDNVQPICLPGMFDEPDPDDVSFSSILGFDNIRDTRFGRIAGFYVWPRSLTLGASVCYRDIAIFNSRNPDEKSNLNSFLTKNHFCVERPFEEVGKSIVVKQNEGTGRVQLIGIGPFANARKTNPIAYSLVQPHRFWIELILKKFKDNVERSL